MTENDFFDDYFIHVNNEQNVVLCLFIFFQERKVFFKKLEEQEIQQSLNRIQTRR